MGNGYSTKLKDYSNNCNSMYVTEEDICRDDLLSCSCVRREGWNKLFSYQNNFITSPVKYINVYTCNHEVCNSCKKCHLSTCDSDNNTKQCYNKRMYTPNINRRNRYNNMNKNNSMEMNNNNDNLMPRKNKDNRGKADIYE